MMIILVGFIRIKRSWSSGILFVQESKRFFFIEIANVLEGLHHFLRQTRLIVLSFEL